MLVQNTPNTSGLFNEFQKWTVRGLVERGGAMCSSVESSIPWASAQI